MSFPQQVSIKNTNVDSRNMKKKQRDPVHGSIYQLKLLMLFLYRGVSHEYNFRLGTEIEEAKKFDDLVFECTKDVVKEYRLLQAKHRSKESKKITVDDLLTESDADYSLVKYFFSYQDSKKEKLFKDGSIKDVIICTNIDLDLKNLESAQIGVEMIEGKDDILDVKCDKKLPVCYRFNEDIISLLKPKLQDYNVIRLARRLSECLLKNNSMKHHDMNDIFQFYHVTLAEEVINVKTKKFHDKFLKDEYLSKDAKKLRKAFVEEIKKQSKQLLRLQDINEAITNKVKIIDDKEVGLTLAKNFGKGQDKSWPNNAISDNEIKDFLSHLVFAVSQPNEEELGKIIKDELGREFDSITTENVYNKFFIKMLNWLQGKEGGRFLSYEDGKEFFEEARSWIPICFDMREPVELFTGRQEQLDQIAADIQHQMVVISGLGGVGKSELAIKYACSRYSQQDSVIWINAEIHETLKESFYKLAKELKVRIQDKDGEERSIRSIVNDVYRFFANRKCLFIFDNAENYIMVKDFLPSGLPIDINKLNILITSLNNLEWRSTRVNMKILSLIDFIDTEAMEFIKKALKLENDLQNEEIVNLAKKMQNLPLALQQAVAYIKEEDRRLKGVNLGKEFKISDYLKEYERKTEDLLKSEVFQEIGHDYKKTVFTALQVTLDKIKNVKEYRQQSFEVMNIMAYFSPDNISTKLFLELLNGDERELMSVIQLLKQYSVVRHNGLLSMHGLVQQVIRLDLEKQQEKGKSLEEITLEKALLLLKKHMVDFNKADVYIPHIISVWNFAKNHDKLIKDFIVNDVTVRGTKYFHLIAGSSSSEVVNLILNKIKTNQSNCSKLNKIINVMDTAKNTPLHYAAQDGDMQIVKLLIKNKANVDTRDKFDNRPLHLAARNGHLGVVNVLLEKKVNVNAETSPKYKFTPLHLAAQNGHLEIVNVLLDKGADINAETKYKFAPLHLAAEHAHLEVVQALLKNSRIKVNVETEYKFTPLHLAAKRGHLEIARALLGKGANIDALDNGHFTPLHLAVQNDHLEVVNILLDKGANVNAQTTKGNTVLHLAAEKYIKVVKSLVTKNVNIDIENEEGKTALNLATERDNSEVIDYIRQQTMFNRRPGTSGISGQLYEINLLMLFLLQGSKGTGSFYLATNVKEAGDFDDVVFKYESGTEKSQIIFLQAKHRENPEKDKITIDQLFSESEKGDFNLKKYFNSYRKVKQLFLEGREDKIFGSKFEDVDFIIYTNALSTFSKNEKSVEKVDLEQNSILYLSEKSSIYYKLIASEESNRKRIGVLQYSSDCKRLARKLAESVFSKQDIVLNEGILRDYHIPLSREVIQKLQGTRKGNLRESFLNSDSQFRSAFFDEVQSTSEFTIKSEDELKLKLQSKSIKLPENFGKSTIRKGKYPESLPNDTVTEDDIREFLSKLKLFVDQSSEEDLSKAIKQKIQKEYKVAQQDIDSVFSDVKNKVLEWWKKGSNYLTENNRIFQDAARISIKFDVRDPVPLFTGRKEKLQELHKLLQNGGQLVISHLASVTGLGGIGKSELARKYINEYCKNYDENIIWITADNYLTIAASFRKLAEDKLGIMTRDENGKEKELKLIVEEVYSFFTKRHRKSLFIFDNAEKHKAVIDVEGAEGVDKFLPTGSNKPHILITSRDQEWGEHTALLQLDVFTEEEAIDFIIKALKVKDGLQENEIRNLAKELQYLPLALQQAVAYIKKENRDSGKWCNRKFTINNYLEMYKEKTKELLNKASDEMHDRYTGTVFTTWQITIDKIKQKKLRGGIQALEILDIIAYLAPVKIPIEGIFSKLISDKEKLHNAVELLDQYSMAVLEQGVLNIHGLVQQVTRIELKGQNKEKEVLRQALTLLQETMEEKTDFKDSMYISHSASAWGYASNDKELVEEFSDLPGKITNELENSVRYEEAYSFGVEALKVLESMLRTDHHYTLTLRNNIAGVLYKQGKYEEALSAYNEVCDKRKHTSSPDHPYTLQAIHNIATVLSNQGKYDEALSIYQEVFNKFQKVLDPVHPYTLQARNNIGQILNKQGMYDKALFVYQDVFDKRKQTLGCDHPDTLNTMHSIAGVLYNQGKYEEASSAYQEVVGKFEQILGSDHPDTLTAKNNIAHILIDQGCYEKALTSYQEIFSKINQILGSDHPDTLTTMHNIAIVLFKQRNYNKALEAYQEVLDKRRQILGHDHPDTLSTSNNLAGVLYEQGKYDEALSAFQEVLDKFKQNLSSDHPDVLSIMNNIASVLDKQGKHDEALKAYQEILNKQKQILSTDHPDTLNTMYEIARVLKGKGKSDEALKAYKENLEKRNQILGPDHPDTLITMYDIAGVLNKQGKYDEALKAYQEILNKQKQILDPDNHDTLNTMHEMAVVLYKLGKYDQALTAYQEVLGKFKQILGSDHLNTLNTMCNLAAVFDKQEKHDEALSTYQEIFNKFNEILGPDHLKTLEMRHSIAIALSKQGKYDEALAVYLEVLDKRKQILGIDHLHTLGTLSNIVRVFVKQGNCDKALKAYQELLDNGKQTLSPNHPYILVTKDSIAEMLDKQSKYHETLALESQGKYYVEALSALQDVFDKSKQILGPNHPNISSTMFSIANILFKQGKYNDALKVYREVLDKEKQIFGPNHLNNLSTKNNIALTLENQGKYGEALKTYNEVLNDSKEILGSDHPNTLSILQNIAAVLFKQQNYDMALRIYQEIFDKKKQVFGSNHLDTINTMQNIAAVLNKQEKHDEVLSMYQEIFDKFNQILGPDHLKTLEMRNSIAVALSKQGKYDEALAAYLKVLDNRKQILGSDHPDTLNIQRNIGVLHFKQGNYDMALKIYQEILDKRKQVLDHNDLSMINSMNNIARIFQAQGRCDQALQTYHGILNKFEQILGYNHQYTMEMVHNVVGVLIIQGKYEEALKIYQDICQNKTDGHIPLHLAARNGHLKLVKYLIDKGGDVLARNNHDTVLHQAVISDNKEVLRFILDKIKVKNPQKFFKHIIAKDTEGDTPLMWAVENGKMDAAELLLEYKADLDVQNNDGETALHWAAKGGHQGIVQLLLDKQADPNIKDNNGETPLNLAQKKLKQDPENDNLKTVTSLLLSTTDKHANNLNQQN